MSASEGFLELLRDQLRGLGPVSVRRLFGGAGIYCDGVMFGLIADDVLYLKVDDANRNDFDAESLAPFTYEKKTGRTEIPSFRRAPERLLDDADELETWARAALGAARRSQHAKPKRKRVGEKST